VALSPGVALPGGGSLLARINGSRPRTNEYLFDGISALQPEPGQVVFYPIIDGIEEFRLNINSYSPEYGRSNGGAVIVSMKSGGNDFHGDIFEFFRNEDLNARNYFAQAGRRPEFRRNQYGLTLGGPIQKDKTFFFVDWQGTRLRTGVTRLSTVPAPAQRQGTFTTPIYDPATSGRTQFVNNRIPARGLTPLPRKSWRSIRHRTCRAPRITTREPMWNQTVRISSIRVWTAISEPSIAYSAAIPIRAMTILR